MSGNGVIFYTRVHLLFEQTQPPLCLQKSSPGESNASLPTPNHRDLQHCAAQPFSRLSHASWAFSLRRAGCFFARGIRSRMVHQSFNGRMRDECLCQALVFLACSMPNVGSRAGGRAIIPRGPVAISGVSRRCSSQPNSRRTLQPDCQLKNEPETWLPSSPDGTGGRRPAQGSTTSGRTVDTAAEWQEFAPLKRA